MANLKLTIELVPSTSWYENMRKVLSRQDWDVLRKKSYTDGGHRCAVCGASGRLNCHEVWEFNDKVKVQTLKGFTALCDMCHHVKHIGFAGILAREGKLDMGDVENHFCQVNGCDYSDYVTHSDKAWKLWEKRSKYNWKIELGEYATLVPGVEMLPSGSVEDTGEFDGYWFWYSHQDSIAGIYYEDNMDADEYIEHWGKWHFSGSHSYLKSIASLLKPYIDIGIIPAMKYNAEPGDGFISCRMCVYCDDRNKEHVRQILSSVGVNNAVWKYDKETFADYSPTGRLFRKAVVHGVWPYVKLAEIADQLFEQLGHSFDPMDDEEVRSVIHRELGFKGRGVSDKVLLKIPHPIAKGIVEYRNLVGAEERY